MKSKKLLVTTLLTLSIVLIPLLERGASAQTKAERRAETERIVEQSVQEANFEIEVSRAIPAKGSSVSLNGGYSLIIRNDSLYSYLPYFGRSYKPRVSGGEGLIFSVVVEKYVMSRGKKGYKVEFTARTDEDTYEYTLQIGLNGSSTFTVHPNQKQPMTFVGEIYIAPQVEQVADEEIIIEDFNAEL